MADINITIGNEVITFPNTGSPADWSQGVVQFAEAVQSVLSGIVGPADISPQTYNISSHNGDGSQPIPSLTFATGVVRSAYVNYYVYRTTSLENAAEAGKFMLIYNPNNSPGFKWEMSREYVGDGLINFTISDTGAISFSTTAMSGASHSGLIGFTATALLQEY